MLWTLTYPETTKTSEGQTTLSGMYQDSSGAGCLIAAYSRQTPNRQAKMMYTGAQSILEQQAVQSAIRHKSRSLWRSVPKQTLTCVLGFSPLVEDLDLSNFWNTPQGSQITLLNKRA